MRRAFSRAPPSVPLCCDHRGPHPRSPPQCADGDYRNLLTPLTMTTLLPTLGPTTPRPQPLPAEDVRTCFPSPDHPPPAVPSVQVSEVIRLKDRHFCSLDHKLGLRVRGLGVTRLPHQTTPSCLVAPQPSGPCTASRAPLGRPSRIYTQLCGLGRRHSVHACPASPSNLSHDRKHSVTARVPAQSRHREPTTSGVPPEPLHCPPPTDLLRTPVSAVSGM